MKKICLFMVMLVSAAACKKKEEKKEEPAPVVTPPPIQISMKLNGAEQKCSNCAFPYSSGNIRGLSFNLPSPTQPVMLNFYIPPLPGTYQLTKDNFSDDDKVNFLIKRDSVFYSAVTGTIHVSESDTSSSGLIENMKATFSFKTDTINGKHYEVTEGAINYKD